MSKKVRRLNTDEALGLQVGGSGTIYPPTPIKEDPVEEVTVDTYEGCPTDAYASCVPSPALEPDAIEEPLKEAEAKEEPAPSKSSSRTQSAKPNSPAATAPEPAQKETTSGLTERQKIRASFGW